MKLLKKFLFSCIVLLIIGFVYYWLLTKQYYDHTSHKYTESTLQENFFTILKGMFNLNFNGNEVSIFSLTLITISHFLLSFLIAAVLGISIGVVIGLNKPLGHISDYLVNFFRVLPSIVFIVIFKYQFRTGDFHVFFVGVIACIWPVIINTKSGVDKVNKTLRYSMKILDIPRKKKLMLFILPEASPNIWDGLKVSFGIAFLISITCEYISSELKGLGSVLKIFDDTQGSVCQSMIIILWMGFMGLLINLLFDYVEDNFSWLKNQPSTEEEGNETKPHGKTKRKSF